MTKGTAGSRLLILRYLQSVTRGLCGLKTSLSTYLHTLPFQAGPKLSMMVWAPGIAAQLQLGFFSYHLCSLAPVVDPSLHFALKMDVLKAPICGDCMRSN